MNEAEKPGGPTTWQFAAVLAILVTVVGAVIVYRNGPLFLDWLREQVAYVNGD